MPVPDFQSLMLPSLRIMGKKQYSIKECVTPIATEFSLSAEECAELIPSGRQTRLYNRIYWAVTYMYKAGLLSRPQRGLYVASIEGKKVLADFPKRIDMRFLAKYESYRQWKGLSGEFVPIEKNGNQSGGKDEIESMTPEERIELVFQELQRLLQDELLDQILQLTPEAFERLTLELMSGMGYGGKGTLEHLGGSGDGGVDGEIIEDALGLNKVYLQAKRYQQDNKVGPNAVREFAGSLDTRGAVKGVFFTTSEFTASAIKDAGRSSKQLILIDGKKFASLLIEHGVAVRVEKTLEIKKIDSDFFNDLTPP